MSVQRAPSNTVQTCYTPTETAFLANFIVILNKFDRMLHKMFESKGSFNYDEMYHKVFKLNGSIRENFIFYKTGLENVYDKYDYKLLYDRYLDLFGNFVDSTI